MIFIYNIGNRLYHALIWLASFFNEKAALWVNGRNNQVIKQHQNSIWFHFASLGEFEQGRPVLERLRVAYPNRPIVISFFSPSGYEVRKNTPLADAVYYLPLDSRANARRFIAAINPTMAVFTKYEYWYHYFNELQKQQVPLYVISSIFRPQQVFFKWYGGLHRKMLSMVNHFFVQDDDSKQLLQGLNVNNVTVSGDTRFDRVWANAQQPKDLPLIAEFKNNQKVLVAGSSWPPDEDLLSQLIADYPDWKFIFAPHEIGEDKISRLTGVLPADETIRFSQIEKAQKPLSAYRVLVIDNIGMLSSLYQYGEAAYIGGGFGVGIHNTLEGAAFGLPVIFGPKYQKFREARELIETQAGFTIGNQEELNNIAAKVLSDAGFRNDAGEKARNYVAGKVGATASIVNYITGKN